MKRLLTSVVVIASLGLTSAGCALFGGGNTGGDDTGGAEQGGGGSGMDPTQFVKAPGMVPVAGNAAVGWTITQDATAGGQTSQTYYAVVGDAGDSWQVEHTNAGLTAMAASMPELKDMVIGLTVKKEDGTVTKAVLGKPGEAGKDIEIMAATATTAEAPQGVDEDVTIGLGSFPAKKFANEYMTSWVGNGGELDGVTLKVAPAQGDAYELSEMPSTETVDAGGTSVETTKYTYSDGSSQWHTTNEIVAAFFPAGEGKGMFKMESASFSNAVTVVGTDAKPQLKW
jgi:hypothetical protein